ncbi:hypothetical protein BKM15_26195 [Pseudomonas syringae pv. syringae]|nr:hypothetical protein BKM15_26195 [Pseudomonas syringae pv. syringae]
MKLTSAQNQLIESNRNSAYYMAGEFYRKFGRYPFEEYYDACINGLISAAIKFDESKGYSFYTLLRIACESQTWKINRNHNLQKRKGKTLSLHYTYDTENGKEVEFEAFLGKEDEYLFFNREYIKSALDLLDDKEKECIRLQFYENMSQKEIGAQLGCSQMTISRLIRRGLNKMRQYYDQVG